MPQNTSAPAYDFLVELTSSSEFPATFGAGGNAGVEDATNANKRYPTWIQAIGAGTNVVVNEDGSSVSLVCVGGEVFCGTFKSVTSIGSTRVRLGTGEPPASPPAAVTSAGTSIADAGEFTDETTVEGALQEVYQGLLTNQKCVHIPIATGILAAGTPLAAFADNAASAPGITLVDSKSVAVRWNNNGTQVAVWYRCPIPQDIDAGADVVVHALVSKSGATVGDATTLTFTGFFQTVAALHDADADLGGASSAVVGNATAKTVTEVTRTLAHADVPAAPCSLALSVKPTDGTLGTDDFLMHDLWIEYTPVLLPS